MLALMAENRVERLVEGHAPAIRALVMSMLGNPSDAEDVTQETVVEVLERRDEVDFDRNPRAWILRIAVNKARDFIRRRRIRTPADEDVDELPASPIASEADVESVKRAYRELPPRYRAALHLAYFEGMRYGEIADLLGLSISAVKMTILRGREMIRVSLKERKS